MPDATLLIANGKIFTANVHDPWIEAVVVRNGVIVFTGTKADARKIAGEKAECVDLKGRLLLPAFNDAHVHFADGGISLLGVDLRRAQDEWEMVRQIADFAETLEPGEWVTGGYWDHELWPGQKLPSRKALDAAGISVPVLVHRVDTHIVLANGIALKLAGITRDTPNPPGGEIHRDPQTGEPNGILTDTAIPMVERVMPTLAPKRRCEAILAAQAHANRLGVTSINDNSSAEDIRVYQDLLHECKLTVRVNAMHREDAFPCLRDTGITAFFGGKQLRIGTIKLFADGSFGAATALLHEPYCDNPENSGLAIHHEEELFRLAGDIDRSGLQLAIHAIGDKAFTMVMESLRRSKRGESAPIRHRIEHAQMVRDEDLARLPGLGAILSLQPSHCLADMKWAGKKIGGRASAAYRLRSFLERGISVAFGSDWPVVTLDPLYGVYAAVARTHPDGSSSWFPGEAISLAEAVTAYTLGSAVAEGQEKVKGTIEVGKMADLAVLDRDIFLGAVREIIEARVDMTFLAGRIVYQRG